MANRIKPFLPERDFFAFAEVRVLLISLAHGVNDMYAAFLNTFVPHIKLTLGLDYALTGALSLIVGLCHIVGQPVIGYFCDRIRRPWLMMTGPLLCGLGAVMLPSAGSYGGALNQAAGVKCDFYSAFAGRRIKTGNFPVQRIFGQRHKVAVSDDRR